MRALHVTGVGRETPLETFARDHMAMCRVADSNDTAELRVYEASLPGVAIGRFHRRPDGADLLTRRITGGRPYAVGPGVVCLTGVYPSLDWLGAGNARPEPEQVLNRALRPLLAVLREAGVDAFYPGRDLVTVGGRPIAVASFTTLPDGVVTVTAALGVSRSFVDTAQWIRSADPDAVVTFDAAAFATSISLEDAVGRPVDVAWAARLAEHAARAHACDAITVDDSKEPPKNVAVAFDALQAERRPALAVAVSAYGIEMLGAIEATATMQAGRIATLELCGDLIAPFGTLEELGQALIGQPPTRAAADRALLGVLTRPGRFLLGARDLPGVIARLGDLSA
jgi:lipoate-protein ligase A